MLKKDSNCLAVVVLSLPFPYYKSGYCYFLCLLHFFLLSNYLFKQKEDQLFMLLFEIDKKNYLI